MNMDFKILKDGSFKTSSIVIPAFTPAVTVNLGEGTLAPEKWFWLNPFWDFFFINLATN